MKKVSEETINNIFKLYHKGYTTGEIARKLNISEVIVVYVLRKD